MRNVIHSDQAPRAVGPYSQAIATEHFVFTAGQVPIDPTTGKLVTGGIREQTARVMANLKAVLEAAGSDLSRVVKATVYLRDIGDYAAFNEAYAGYFPAEPPARSAFQVAALPMGADIEIEMIALTGVSR